MKIKYFCTCESLWSDISLFCGQEGVDDRIEMTNKMIERDFLRIKKNIKMVLQ